MEQDTKPLAARRVCVTGATQGIGLAIARGFAVEGARVVINAQNADDGGALAAMPAGADCHYIQADLATTDGPADLIAKAAHALGGIDTLVCNAGSFFDVPFGDLTAERIDRTFNLNVRGAMLTAQAFAAQVTEGQDNPSIVCTGSTNSRAAEKDSVAYDTSKGAVLMMIRSLALSLAGQGIRVNGIGPGLVDTLLTATGLSVPGVRDKVTAQIPLGRIGRPEDVAGAALFLASAQACYITGQMLYVDGGILAQQMSWDPAN